jgi:hypothetical protein
MEDRDTPQHRRPQKGGPRQVRQQGPAHREEAHRLDRQPSLMRPNPRHPIRAVDPIFGGGAPHPVRRVDQRDAAKAHDQQRKIHGQAEKPVRARQQRHGDTAHRRRVVV